VAALKNVISFLGDDDTQEAAVVCHNWRVASCDEAALIDVYLVRCRKYKTRDWRELHAPRIPEEVRARANKWLLDMNAKEIDLPLETIHLSAHLVDRLMSMNAYKPKLEYFKLLCLGSLYVTSKYHSQTDYLQADFIVDLGSNDYDRRSVLLMESLIFKELDFRLASPTPYVLAEMVLGSAWELLYSRRYRDAYAFHIEPIRDISRALLDVTLYCSELLRFDTAAVACAVLVLSIYTVMDFDYKSGHDLQEIHLTRELMQRCCFVLGIPGFAALMPIITALEVQCYAERERIALQQSRIEFYKRNPNLLLIRLGLNGFLLD
jgi:hypothetical protein